MLINFKKACEILGVKPGTLYQWVEARFVPVIRVGRLLKFDELELTDWFKKGYFAKAKQELLRGKNGKAC
jgi:excisionase family DNA binding protein